MGSGVVVHDLICKDTLYIRALIRASHQQTYWSITKLVCALKDTGLNIRSQDLIDLSKRYSLPVTVSGQNLKIAKPIDLINQSMLTSLLAGTNIKNIVYALHTDSTQSYLNQHDADMCIAEWQSRGYGRRGHRWQSPFGCNVLFSLKWKSTLEEGEGFSLLAGLFVVQYLSVKYPHIQWQVKWPNDVYANGKKLGGIIVEKTVLGSICHWVVGLGVNVNMEQGYEFENGLKPTSLTQLCGVNQDRTVLTAGLVEALTSAWSMILKEGLVPYLCRYQKSHYLHSKHIQYIHKGDTKTGKVVGVSPSGGLIIVTKHQKQVEVCSEAVKNLLLCD